MPTRRAQKPITIRSDKAAAKLGILTRTGRSQAEVIEEALDRMPAPPANTDGLAARLERLDAIISRTSAAGVVSMAEFDAEEYDEFGSPR